MIARLRGKVIEAYPNRLVVDVHGVGYEVNVPLSTFDRLNAAEGVEVDLRTDLRADAVLGLPGRLIGRVERLARCSTHCRCLLVCTGNRSITVAG